MTKPKQHSVVMWLGAAALGLVLTACGSGSVEGSAVTGMALTDGPIQGTVSLNDSSVQVKSRTVSTRSDGTFSIDVADLTPPYLLKVEWQGAAGGKQLFAVSEGNDNLDVNPISDVAFDAASGDRDSAEVFSASQPDDNRRTATRARALLVTLTSVLAPLFERYGITDPLTDKAAVRALLADVTVTRDDGVVTVTNKATGGVIFEGPVSDLASGTFFPDQMPAGPGTTPPPPGTCTSFTYSAWSTCQNNTQTRTVVTRSPTGCTGGSPVTTQACTTTPPPPVDGAALYQQYCAGCHGTSKLGSSATSIQNAINANTGGMGTNALRALTSAQIAAIAAAGTTTPTTCTSFTYSAWGACQSNNTQTRTVSTRSPTGCTGGSPVTSQACTYVPPVTTCSSFTYSAWGTCQSNNTQTRSVNTSSPTGCTGGSPVTSQACTYVPPIDGAALYTQYCSSCHGNGKKGSSASAIQSAIDSNRGGMGTSALRALTPAQVAAIAAAP